VTLRTDDDLAGWFLAFDRVRGTVHLSRHPHPPDDFWADLVGRGHERRDIDGPFVAEARFAAPGETRPRACALLVERSVVEIYIESRLALTHRVTELSAATSWASSSSTATSAARPRSRPPAGRARPPSHPHIPADGRGALSFPAHEAAAITVASGQSSLQAFRVGIGVASALVIIGGLIGATGIRNP
jgi:hypothetical protein